MLSIQLFIEEKYEKLILTKYSEKTEFGKEAFKSKQIQSEVSQYELVSIIKESEISDEDGQTILFSTSPEISVG